AANGYIGRLITKGYKVGICEQIEDPKEAKGIVKRDVVRIITPGTMLDENFMDNKRNNYIMSVTDTGERYGLAFCDISTGEFQGTYIGKSLILLDNEISKFSPTEVVVTDLTISEHLKSKWNMLINVRQMEDAVDKSTVQNYFKSLSGGYNSVVASASSLLLA